MLSGRPPILAILLGALAWGCGGASEPSGPVCQKPCETVVETSLVPQDLRAGAGSLFWTTASPDAGNAVWSVPATGSAPRMLVSVASTGVPSLAVDVGHVYWTGDHAVHRALLDGTMVEDLATGIAWPGSLVVDAQSAYFSYLDDPGVAKVPLGGGTPTDLGAELFATLAAADGGSLYGAAGFQQDSVFRLPLDGSPGETLATIDDGVVGMAVGPDAIYYTTKSKTWLKLGATTTYHAWTLPRSGGTPVAITTLTSEGKIAVDESGVYFTDSGAGKLMRASLDGRSVDVLADHLDYPYLVVLDAGHVYWTERTTQVTTIRRMAK